MSIYEMLTLSTDFMVMLNCVDDHQTSNPSEVVANVMIDKAQVTSKLKSEWAAKNMQEKNRALVYSRYEDEEINLDDVELYINSNEIKTDPSTTDTTADTTADNATIRDTDIAVDHGGEEKECTRVITNMVEILGSKRKAAKRKLERRLLRRQKKANNEPDIDDESSTKSITEKVLKMKKSYMQNNNKNLDWSDRIYQHGKSAISARRELEKSRQKEMDRNAQFEMKFQEKLKAARTSSGPSKKNKKRAIRLYDLSRPKQLEGRLRRDEIIHKSRMRAERNTPNGYPRGLSSSYSYAYSYCSTTSGLTDSSTSRTKSLSSEDQYLVS